MKKVFYILAMCALVSCAKTGTVSGGVTGLIEEGQAISFEVNRQNMTKAETLLQNAGHYNFGVWAYKSTTDIFPVMNHYLVGYMDSDAARGYHFGAEQTTIGKSKWAYEKMGYTQYNQINGLDEFYYQNDKDNPEAYPQSLPYMSNQQEQWLKYWDFSSDWVEFFAYAPYIKGANRPVYDREKGTLAFADNSIVAGFDDRSMHEYMYAYLKQFKAEYNTPVTLRFRRMTSKVNIRFYEMLDGYDVQIIDLQGNTEVPGGATAAKGVQATPAVRNGQGTAASPYTYLTSSSFYTKAKALVTFPDQCVTEGTSASMDNLVFAIPADEKIADNKLMATPSPSTYYAIPLGQDNNTGFTFHVSYRLTAKDTGETIIVNNATVHVPAANVQWKPNYHYTYTFRITSASGGNTDGSASQDYNSPEPDYTPALYPIIFDGCTVEEWIREENEYPIG